MNTTSITQTNDVDMLDASDASIGLDLPSPLDVIPEPTLSNHGQVRSNGQGPVPESTLSHESRNTNPPPPVTEETTTVAPALDDIERLICHEHFPALLAMATKVKEIRHAMDADNVPANMSPSSLNPTHVIAAVSRIKEAFHSKGSQMPNVQKGTYPLTDSLVDESFEILQKEMERCEEWYKQRETTKPGKGKGRIAAKYAKWQTDILMGWIIENKHYPFPSPDEIKELAQETGLSETQIINWTTNVRKRNLKATVEGGKKPHHFIDFVFLANDRDQRLAQGLPPRDASQVAQSKRARKNKKYQIDPPPTVALDLTAPSPFAIPPSHDPFASQQPSSSNQARMQHQNHTLQPFPAFHAAEAVPPPADVPLPPIEWDLSSSHDDDEEEEVRAPSQEETKPDPLSAFANYWSEQQSKNKSFVPTLTTSEMAFESFQAETNGGITDPMDILAAASIMQVPRANTGGATPDHVASI